MTKDECKCAIQVYIHNIEAECKVAYDMVVAFERGKKQHDETRRFQLNPQTRVVEINETFQRTSGFYFDKRNEKWFSKTCSLILGYYVNNQFRVIGTNEIDMADMVDKGEVTKVYAFRNDSLYAKTNVTFRIDSGVDQSSASV